MSQPRPRWRCYATTSAGLEPFLIAELESIGARRVRRGATGVSFDGDRELVMKACLTLRTAHRVLWVLGDVDAADAQSLYRSVRKVARWKGLIPPNKTLAVYASARDTVFRDSRFVALKTKDAIVDVVRDATGQRPSVDLEAPDVVVRVSLNKRRGVISLDAAGDSLHLRGYRSRHGAAPLRETLAAGLVMASGWEGQGALIDPFCGAGTVLIEAALMARRVPPGIVRERYGFMGWPGHRADRYKRLRAKLRDKIRQRGPLKWPIIGGDRDLAVVQSAIENARDARVEADIQFATRRLDLLENPTPGRPGVIVTNPPYGERMSNEKAVEVLLGRLGERLRHAFGDWTVCLLVPPQLVDAVGLPVQKQWPVRNGPLDVRIVRYTVPVTAA